MLIKIKFLLLLFLFSLSLSAFSKGTAKLYVKQTTYDLGLIKKESPDRTIYIDFQNKGNQKLVISDVQVSCHCVTVDYPKDFIPVGGKAKLAVHFTAKDLFPQVTTKTITILSNNSKGPVTLQLKAKIEY